MQFGTTEESWINYNTLQVTCMDPPNWPRSTNLHRRNSRKDYLPHHRRAYTVCCLPVETPSSTSSTWKSQLSDTCLALSCPGIARPSWT
jgi:hypothetical protein